MMDVSVRCICPPRPGGQVRHPGGDTITLRDKLDFRGVASIRWAIGILKDTDPNATSGETFGLLTEQYVLAGVEAWTLVDDQGDPVPVDPATIRQVLLPEIEVAIQVADEADDLYLPVILPLLRRLSTSSPPTPTTESTSQRIGSSESALTPLRPFSTSTTPTDDTGETSSSPEPGSSSSPSLASVG